MPEKLENDENQQIKINKPDFGMNQEPIQVLPTTSKTLTTQGAEEKYGSFDSPNLSKKSKKAKAPTSPNENNIQIEGFKQEKSPQKATLPPKPVMLAVPSTNATSKFNPSHLNSAHAIPPPEHHEVQPPNPALQQIINGA